MLPDYQNINKESWNKRTDIHWDSDFYDNKAFISGTNSLNEIELALLGDLQGKSVLHLQCHFGQDTISFARLGATAAVGVDLSDRAIEKAKELTKLTETEDAVDFICCDIYDLPKHLSDKQFDIVFTSYGTIGWLPDLDIWANIVARYLKPQGRFVFAEFHPVVWMFDDDFTKISYDYFNTKPIVEAEEGTYTENDQNMGKSDYVMWNHSMGEVATSLVKAGLKLEHLQEYDYSPYPCFKNTVEVSKKKYRIASIEHLIPMVYSLAARKAMN